MKVVTGPLAHTTYRGLELPSAARLSAPWPDDVFKPQSRLLPVAASGQPPAPGSILGHRILTGALRARAPTRLDLVRQATLQRLSIPKSFANTRIPPILFTKSASAGVFAIIREAQQTKLCHFDLPSSGDELLVRSSHDIPTAHALNFMKVPRGDAPGWLVDDRLAV